MGIRRSRLQIFLHIISFQILVTAALTDPNDLATLNGLKGDWQNTPPNWVGSDPCGALWEGIQCINSRIIMINLAGMGLAGTLNSEIGNFPLLQTLDLSQNRGFTGRLPLSIVNLANLQTLSLLGCSFSGPIPENIGSLTKLVTLSLASNKFTGHIPPSIGKMSNLSLLDLTENSLNGTIPVSDGTSPGLDLLLKAKHFHMGKNQFSGSIPSKLLSSGMQLIHLLFDSNQLTGSPPSTVQLVQTLEVIRLDRNKMSGPILLNFTRFPNLNTLYLSNNIFTGSIPDLSTMNSLSYLDMSNNSFDPSTIPPWFSTLQSLTSLTMERTQLQGPVPTSLFSSPEIQSIILSNNQLNSTLDIGNNFGSQLQLIDIQNNSIGGFAVGTGYHKTLMLQGNQFCEKLITPESYCTSATLPTSTYSTPAAKNCSLSPCSGNQIRSPNCNCAHPITGNMYFRSFTFSDFNNATYYIFLWQSMMDAFSSNKLPVDTISLFNPIIQSEEEYLRIRLEVFPTEGDRFNRSGFSVVTSQINNITFFKRPIYFGPFFFLLENDSYFTGSNRSSKTGLIIGTAVGASIFVLLLLIIGLYAFRQRKRAERATHLSNPFASWDRNKSNAPPQIKGVRSYTFEELKKCTDNFSQRNIIGAGGYGKVYKGTLATGELAAIKRAQQGSLQGSDEFKNEIELLSRVHHRNLVSLLGFCYELGEQMLVYEYVPNGTLKDNISGKLGTQLSWRKRLTIALDSAKGIAYLHELADPPIIHRDIKSNNILMDNHLTAKVADFGLSKPFQEGEGHVTTGVKGTMGYMDPEYFMTEQLTEKSDVYSFGVVMLEILTGRKPIERGSHIVRDVRMALDRTKEFYNLQEILDPAISWNTTTVRGTEKFTDLALRCVEEATAGRPTMGEVVKELEDIIKLAGGPEHRGETESSVEMVYTSASYDGKSDESFYGGSQKNKNYFEYSGSMPLVDITRQ